MKQIIKYSLTVAAVASVFVTVWESAAIIPSVIPEFSIFFSPDTLADDTTQAAKEPPLPYPFEDNPAPQSSGESQNPLYLSNPSNIDSKIEYDPETGQYNISQKMGDINFKNPSYMTLEEYGAYDADKALKNYWKQRSSKENFETRKAIIPPLKIGSKIIDRVFGGSTVDIRPQGSAKLTFALNHQRNENPSLPVKARSTTNFDFNEEIQMSVTGSIGDKLKLTTNYNTEATFDFENKMKLEYSGQEDEIIKKIEVGNVSLPASGSLITGSQTLFGIKTETQFGKLWVTSVFSQEKGKKQQVDFKNGAKVSEFEIKADQYEGNKHYFLSMYFRDKYESALSNLPFVKSNINITKIEVWVTGRPNQVTNARDIVAFQDIGEADYYDKSGFVNSGNTSLPDNNANSLYRTLTDSTGIYIGIRDINNVNSTFSGTALVAAQDYDKIETARLLSTSEYTVNKQLGYISLNSLMAAADVLAVAYQYTLNGTTYQVGEFSNAGISSPSALIVKLLKSTETRTDLPTWDLMMKNVYSIGSYNIQQDGFKLNVLYKDPDVGTPANYIKEGSKYIKSIPLIEAMNLDNLDANLDPQPDGRFDFINGVTIIASNGRIYFPVLEPFGDHLRKKITGQADNDYDINLETTANKYVYDEMYDMTKSQAEQFPDKNRFSLNGSYQSTSTSEISLGGMNIPQGSVIVTAGGIQLEENVHYTVDYTLGKIRIIDEGLLNSNSNISVSFESNTLFNIQSKTLMGSRFDYKLSKDINVGATILNLTERPITQKINIGDEPISNTIWGLDGNYKKDAPFITKLIDKIPLLETKDPSSVTVNAEFAHLIPGHSKAVGKEGIAYLDDFEGSRSSIDLKSNSQWGLASTPKDAIGQNGAVMFPEAGLTDSLPYGYNRAKLSWYNIDPLFARNDNITPKHIKDDVAQQSNHYVREIQEPEIFPNKQPVNGQTFAMSVFDVVYDPREKGPYNYDAATSGYSAGIDSLGKLMAPQTRWGGIMRPISTNDFEAANIEFIEFWMMDPFHAHLDFFEGNGAAANHKGGDLYFNLGSISEDVLKDERKSYENGLPVSVELTNIDYTAWGRVPSVQPTVDAFDNNPKAREFQDVGMDGLSNVDENSFFSDYLNAIGNLYSTGSEAYKEASKDPSSDDYHYYRGDDYDGASINILDRYEAYNGLEGNSTTTEKSEGLNKDKYPTSATTLPNREDINRNNTLDESENYYQYRVSLRPEDMVVGKNFITDAVTGQGSAKNGSAIDVKWYQFKIPLKSPEKTIGNIQDFNSIRFARMYMTGFQQKVICRFARLELVRNEWRKFECKTGSGCLEPQEMITDDNFDATSFDVSAVNIEENGSRTPIPYVLPPDIERQKDIATTNLRELNEQSLSLKVCGTEGLLDGDSRAIYKITDFDFRSYKKFKMFVHAESVSDQGLKYGDLTVFVRLGVDFTDNYYEYEIPLSFTPPGSSAQEAVWPKENHFDFQVSVLQDAKTSRNKEGYDPSIRYPWQHDRNKVWVKGNPDLSRVKTIMIGIRNPKKTSATPADDGWAKCAEVWVNEMRLSDFDEKGGWAANTRVSTKLADLGNVTLAGNVRTPGFGSIEKKVSERDRETSLAYDVSSSIKLEKFLPEKWGLKIPMHLAYSKTLKKPQYNPLDPDIFMKDALNELASERARDSLKEITTDVANSKSINFTNVKKVKGKGAGKPRFYDIENLTFTYAFTETNKHDINTEFDNTRTYIGAAGYNFNFQPKYVQPFKKLRLLKKSKSMQLIRDINFSYSPSLIALRTDMNRRYSEYKPRNTTDVDLILRTQYAKLFTWNRIYDLKYDLTKSIKLDYSATSNARIDEPEGSIRDQGDVDNKWKRDSIWKNITNFGRNTKFRHTLVANYTLPLSKLPALNWLSATTSYKTSYNWTAAPLGLQRDSLGHTIQNTQGFQHSGQATMTRLYHKVKYFKKLDDKYNKAGNKQKEPDYKILKYEKEGVNFKEDEPKNINHKLGTTDINIEVFDQDGKEVKGKIFITNENKITFTTKQEVKKAKVIVSGKKLKRKINFQKIMEYTLLGAMSLKNVSITYSEDLGTTIPGYLPDAKMLGSDWDRLAPGAGFIFGYQPNSSWQENAAQKGWLSRNKDFNSNFQQVKSNSINGRGTLEPLPGFRIDLTALRNETKSFSEIFKDTTGEGNNFMHLSPMESGSFTISYITLGTAFSKDNKEHLSRTFTEFDQNRQRISRELSQEYENRSGKKQAYNSETGYYEGFGGTSQEVLVPAFLEAYTGVKSFKTLFNPFIKIPKPNWRLTYDGLIKIPFIKKYFKNFTIAHGYRSTLTISSFATNLQYGESEDFTNEKDLHNNYFAKYEIGQITISEQFSPLFKIDMTWQNGLITQVELKKTRNLNMNYSNNQLSEVRGSDIVFGGGYRFKDVKIPLKFGKNNVQLKSDVNIRANVSIRNNKTLIRKLVENTNTPSAGNRAIAIDVTAGYVINKRFNLQFFYRKNILKPFVSSSFETASTQAGFSIIFTLAP